MIHLFSIACMLNLQFGCIRFLQDLYTLHRGFDTVDDESRSEKPVDRTFSSKNLAPQQWDIADNPPGCPIWPKADGMTCNIEYISNTSCLKILRSYKYYSYFIQSNLRLLNMFRHQTLVPTSLFDAIHYILTLQCSTSFVVSKHNLLTGKA